jgi:hypothetical protein
LSAKPGAVVDDGQAHGAQFAVSARAVVISSHLAVGPVGHRVQRVLHQVVDDLAQLGGVAQDARQVGLPAGPPAAAVVQRLAVQRQHLGAPAAFRSSGFSCAAGRRA